MRPDTPALTVDLIIEMKDQDRKPIVLIERRYAPLGWALPGGFVDPGETVAAAARREALEETSLEVELSQLLGVYSEPARDPRGHTVSVVFVAQASGIPRAADDAIALRLFDPQQPPELAFDHDRIVQHYCNWRQRGHLPLPD